MIDNKINMVEEFPLETMEELYTPEDQIIVDDEEADNENQKILKRSQLYWKDYLEEKNYNRDINKMCDICIADQKATHGKVVIKCKGLADIRTELGDELVDEYEECLPPEEFRKIQSLYDPYAFMEEFLDVDNKGKEDRRFAKRWYQEMAIRCVHEDTFIHLSDGTYKAIKDINIGEKVVSYDTNKLSVNYNIITNKWYSGEKEVFKISLDNDSILEVTKEHPILIEGNTYLSLEDGLTIGDKVVSYTEDVIVLVTVIDIVSIGVHNTYDIEVENDHNFIANTVVVHNCTAQEKNIRMGRRCIPHYEKVLTKDGYRPISELKVGDLVKSLNSKNQKFRYSPITKVINNGIKVVFRLTLKNGKKVECTENHPLLIKTSKGKQWSTLETGLFIGHKVCYRKRNKIFTSELVDIERVGEVLTYDISVGKDATFLVDDIITHNTGKSFALSLLIIHRAVMAKSTSGYRILIVSPFAAQTEEVVDNIINICRLLLDDPIKSFKGSPNHEIIFKTGAILKGFTASKEANSIRGQPGDLLVIDECLVGSTLITTPTGLVPIKDIKIGDTVLTYLDGKLVEDTVINSRSTGVKTVRDYTFSNGTVLTGTSNHPVMTPEGWKDLGEAVSILIPESNLYTTVVSKSEEYQEEVYNLTVGSNHTYIANGLLTHNCDDMPVKAMVSIMGIRMGRPNVEVWKSGTPKGEKNLFAGDQKVTSKSFHFPSFVIPHYTDELDADNRADLGEIGYVQEVIAEYGAVANGVYQSDFLRRAQERPVFTTAKEVLGRRNNFIVITGVDWNGEGVGVRIITVAYNKFSPDFKIIDRQEISMIGKTQDEAVNTIIEVNRKFKVDHLYCDIGYGAYQVEALKIFGERAFSSTPKGHPDRKLVNVIGVNFGGTTDLKDHRTGEVHKVPTKQFAVQNSVLLLEKDLISLHPKEDHVMLLQMKNYIEKSRNKGRIVYTTISKKIGDHDLDAFIFALYGFKIEYPTIFGEASMRAMIRYGDETGTSNVDVLGADVPFISLSFGSKQNAMIGHSSRAIKGSNPGRSIVIGNIRRRDNFR